MFGKSSGDTPDFLKISRGKELSEYEVRKMLFYKDTGKSKKEITKLIKRSKTVIIRKQDSKKIKQYKREKNLIALKDRQIFRQSTKTNLSVLEISKRFSKITASVKFENISYQNTQAMTHKKNMRERHPWQMHHQVVFFST